MRLLEQTTKIWMKIDPYYRRRRCSPITLDSGNIRFMLIFAGVAWRGASNDCGVIENMNFSGFRTLRLRHLRKCGQHYYIVLFSPLSPFHWPQNIWPWVPLNGLNDHFTLNFQYYELTFRVLLAVFESIIQFSDGSQSASQACSI